MHPTVDEQLDGIARLVEQAADRLLEQIDDAPTADRLRTAAATLRRLAAGWSQVLPFLTWDNAATLALLESLGDGVRARQVAAGRLDPLDAGAVHARNLELRALLAESIRERPAAGSSGPAASARAAVAAHVRERIARDPSGSRPRRSP